MVRIPNLVHTPAVDAILGVPFILLGVALVAGMMIAGIDNVLQEHAPDTGFAMRVLCGREPCWAKPLSTRLTEVTIASLFAAGFIALGGWFVLRRVEASCDPDTGEIHLQRMPRFLGLRRVVPAGAWASFEVRQGFMVVGGRMRPTGWRIEGILREGPSVWLGFVAEKKDAEGWAAWLSQQTKGKATRMPADELRTWVRRKIDEMTGEGAADDWPRQLMKQHEVLLVHGDNLGLWFLGLDGTVYSVDRDSLARRLERESDPAVVRRVLESAAGTFPELGALLGK